MPDAPATRRRVRKEDIVRRLAAEHGMRLAEVKLIVQGTLDAIVDAVIEVGRLELRDFGVFEVRTRKARRRRNPQTGVPVEVPATQVVTFRPGCNFKHWVRIGSVKGTAGQPENGSRSDEGP